MFYQAVLPINIKSNCLFSRKAFEFGFVLLAGKYQPLEPNSQGWLLSQQLELYLGVDREKLRFFTPEGQLIRLLAEVGKSGRGKGKRNKKKPFTFNLYPFPASCKSYFCKRSIPTPEEVAQQAQQHKQRSDRLAAKLR